MANSLTAIIPKILAYGVKAVRENAVMPLLVNRGYETLAGQKGSTIDVVIPSSVSVTDVTPAETPPVGSTLAPTVVPITMNNWKMAKFPMSDKDILETENESYIEQQVSEAIKPLVTAMDNSLFSTLTGIWKSAGTPGTTPFAPISPATEGTVAAAVNTAKMLNKIPAAPMSDRRLVFNEEAEAAALMLRPFNDYSFSGDVSGILEGKVGRKFGFSFFMDQNVPTFTCGSRASYTTDTTGYAAGVKQVTIITGTGTISVGEVFTFAGSDQQYVCTELLSAPGALKFEPALVDPIAASATAITFWGTASTAYPQNIGFHRDAFAFASRPLADSVSFGNSIIDSVTDPLSGLTLRLEISREHKQTSWAFDVLWGVALVRPELACRLWG